MEGEEYFEYDKYLVTLRSAENESKVIIELVAADKSVVYTGEKKLQRFSSKTIATALSRLNTKLSAAISLPEPNTAILRVSFADSIVGQMFEEMTLTKLKDFEPVDFLRYIGAKLHKLASLQEAYTLNLSKNRFVSTYVESCGLSPSLFGNPNFEEEDFYEEANEVDKEVGYVSLDPGTYLVTISMLIQAAV